MTEREEDLWDLICANIGFDKQGMEIQQAIRNFVKIREEKLIAIVKAEADEAQGKQYEKAYDIRQIQKKLESLIEKK